MCIYLQVPHFIYVADSTVSPFLQRLSYSAHKQATHYPLMAGCGGWGQQMGMMGGKLGVFQPPGPHLSP
jgi:hypothetical protein